MKFCTTADCVSVASPIVNIITTRQNMSVSKTFFSKQRKVELKSVNFTWLYDIFWGKRVLTTFLGKWILVNSCYVIFVNEYHCHSVHVDLILHFGWWHVLWLWMDVPKWLFNAFTIQCPMKVHYQLEQLHYISYTPTGVTMGEKMCIRGWAVEAAASLQWRRWL